MFRSKSRIFPTMIMLVVMFFAGICSFGVLGSIFTRTAVAYNTDDLVGEFKENDKYDAKNKSILISSIEDLKLIAKVYKDGNPMDSSKVLSFRMLNDINMDKVTVPTLGTVKNPFSSIFFGDGYIIKNMSLGNANIVDESLALFPHTSGATIHGLGLENVKIGSSSTTVTNIGAFVGYGESTVLQECYVTGTVSYDASNYKSIYVGGMIGRLNNGKVYDCYSNATVTNNGLSNQKRYAGGIIGYASGNALNDRLIKVPVIENHTDPEYTKVLNAPKRQGGNTVLDVVSGKNNTTKTVAEQQTQTANNINNTANNVNNTANNVNKNANNVNNTTKTVVEQQTQTANNVNKNANNVNNTVNNVTQTNNDAITTTNNVTPTTNNIDNDSQQNIVENALSLGASSSNSYWTKHHPRIGYSTCYTGNPKEKVDEIEYYVQHDAVYGEEKCRWEDAYIIDCDSSGHCIPLHNGQVEKCHTPILKDPYKVRIVEPIYENTCKPGCDQEAWDETIHANVQSPVIAGGETASAGDSVIYSTGTTKSTNNNVNNININNVNNSAKSTDNNVNNINTNNIVNNSAMNIDNNVNNININNNVNNINTNNNVNNSAKSTDNNVNNINTKNSIIDNTINVDADKTETNNDNNVSSGDKTTTDYVSNNNVIINNNANNVNNNNNVSNNNSGNNNTDAVMSRGAMTSRVNGENRILSDKIAENNIILGKSSSNSTYEQYSHTDPKYHCNRWDDIMGVSYHTESNAPSSETSSRKEWQCQGWIDAPCNPNLGSCPPGGGGNQVCASWKEVTIKTFLGCRGHSYDTGEDECGDWQSKDYYDTISSASAYSVGGNVTNIDGNMVSRVNNSAGVPLDQLKNPKTYTDKGWEFTPNAAWGIGQKMDGKVIEGGLPFLRIFYGKDINAKTQLAGRMDNPEVADYFEKYVHTSGTGTYLVGIGDAKNGRYVDDVESATIGYNIDNTTSDKKTAIGSLADLGYKFLGWTYGGQDVENGSGNTVSGLTKSGKYIAKFEYIDYTANYNVKLDDETAPINKRYSEVNNGMYGAYNGGNSIVLNSEDVFSNNYSVGIGYKIDGWQANGVFIAGSQAWGASFPSHVCDIGWIQKYCSNMTEMIYSVLISRVAYDMVLTQEGSGAGQAEISALFDGNKTNTIRVGDKINFESVTNSGYRTIRWELRRLNGSGKVVDPANDILTIDALDEMADNFDLTQEGIEKYKSEDGKFHIVAIIEKEVRVTVNAMADDGDVLMHDNVAGVVDGNILSRTYLAYNTESIKLGYKLSEGYNIDLNTAFWLRTGGDDVSIGNIDGENAVLKVNSLTDIVIDCKFYRNSYTLKYYIYDITNKVTYDQLGAAIGVDKPSLDGKISFDVQALATPDKFNDVIRLTAQVFDVDHYRLVSFVESVSGKPDNGNVLASASGNTLNTSFNISGNKTYFLIIMDASMSIALNSQVLVNEALGELAEVNEPRPSDNIVTSGDQTSDSIVVGLESSTPENETVVTLKVKPRVGYRFESFKFRGEVIAEGLTPDADGYYVYNVRNFVRDKAGAYVANFSKIHYNIVSASVPGGAIIFGKTDAYINMNTYINFNVNEGYRVLGYSVTPDGKIVTAMNGTKLNITSEMIENAVGNTITLYPRYETMYKLTYKVEGAVVGCNVEVWRGNVLINRPGDYYDQNTEFKIVINISSKLPHHEAIVTGLGEGERVGNTITFKITENRDITITFGYKKYNIALETNEGYVNAGDLSVNDVLGSSNELYGSIAKISATIKPGYAFLNWEVWNGEKYVYAGSNSSFSIRVAGDAKYRAIYTDNYTINTIVAGGVGGTISPTPTFQLVKGNQRIISAYAEAGWKVAFWQKNGNRLNDYDGMNSISITGEADATYTVTFEKIKYSLNFDTFEKDFNFELTDAEGNPVGDSSEYGDVVKLTVNGSKVPLQWNGTIFVNNTAMTNDGVNYPYVYTLNITGNSIITARVTYVYTITIVSATGYEAAPSTLVSALNITQDNNVYSALKGSYVYLRTSSNDMFKFTGFEFKYNVADEFVEMSALSEFNFVLANNVIIRPVYTKVQFYVNVENKTTENSEIATQLSDNSHSIIINETEPTDKLVVYGDELRIAPKTTIAGYEFSHYEDERGNNLGTTISKTKLTAGMEKFYAMYNRTEHTINVNKDILVDGKDVGDIIGGGSFKIDDSVKIDAIIASAYKIIGWKVNGQELVFTNSKATFEKMTFFMNNNSLSTAFIPNATDSAYVIEAIAGYNEYKIELNVYAMDSNESAEGRVGAGLVQVKDDLGNLIGDEAVKKDVHVGDCLVLTVKVLDDNYRFEGFYRNTTLVTMGVYDAGTNSYSYTIDDFVVNSTLYYSAMFSPKTSVVQFIVEPYNAFYPDLMKLTYDGTVVGSIITYVYDPTKLPAIFTYDGLFRRVDGVDTLLSLENNYTYTINSNDLARGITFVAKFTAIDFNVNILAPSNGVINRQTPNLDLIDATGINKYNADDGLILYFTANTGYKIKSVTVGGVDATDKLIMYSGGLTAYWRADFTIFIGKQQPIVIETLFELVDYDITTRVIYESLIDEDYSDILKLTYSNTTLIDDKLSYQHGSDIKIEIDILVEGYEITNLSAGGKSYKYVDGGITLTDCIGDLYITIEYQRKNYTISFLANDESRGTTTGSNSRYRIGDEVVLVASAYQGNVFESITKDGNTVSTAPLYKFVFAVGDEGTYTANFIAKKLTLTTTAYTTKLGSSSYDKLIIDGNEQRGATLTVNGVTIGTGTKVDCEYGMKIGLSPMDFQGHNFIKVMMGDVELELNDNGEYLFDLTQACFAASIDGVLDLKIVYTIKSFNYKLITNFHTGTDPAYNIYGQDGNVIKPADVLYDRNGLTYNYSATINSVKKFDYKTTLNMSIKNIISDYYVFEGLFIGNKKLDVSYSNGVYSLANYVILDDVTIMAKFSPRIRFTTDVFERNYDGGQQKISTQNEIIVSEDLRQYVVVLYNNSPVAPCNVTKDNNGFYNLSAYINLPALKNFVVGASGLKIYPALINLKFVNEYTKVYDGSADAFDALANVKLDNDDIMIADLGLLRLDTTDAVVRVRRGSNDATQVGTGYNIYVRGVKLSVIDETYSILLNNYILTKNGTDTFNGVASITPKNIYLSGVVISNKVFDGNNEVINYPLENNPIIAGGQILAADADEVKLDWGSIRYKYSANLGSGLNATGSMVDGSNGLTGLLRYNYKLVLPIFRDLTIHPDRLVYENASIGKFVLVDVNKNLFLPVNAELQVTMVDSSTTTFNEVNAAVAGELSGKQTLRAVYNFAVYNNGVKLNINKPFRLEITLPFNAGKSVVSFIQVDLIADTINNINNSTVDGGTNANFTTNKLSLLAIISASTPVATWVIILIISVLLLILLFIFIYIFVILPKHREKVYLKYNKIT